MFVKRTIQQAIEKLLFKGKAIIVYGPRRTGKTTLLQNIEKKYAEQSLYINCDEFDTRQQLTNTTSTQLKLLIGRKKLIFIDEAHRVENIGLTLKIFVDMLPGVQVVATGSSSFELSNTIIEPLTGRKHEFFLYPFSLEELAAVYSSTERNRRLEHYMLYGMYPDVIRGGDSAEQAIKEIARSYLYKDVLAFHRVRNADMIDRLLQALALQTGNEVSYQELAQLIGMNRVTVQQYIDLLEKAFIIFRLKAFSKNPRTELSKRQKIYFVDTGVRNALIRNTNPLALRTDAGALWENFVISERRKFHENHDHDTRLFFWRTYQQQEIDLIEEQNGSVAAFECKLKEPQTVKQPSEWTSRYPGARVQVITKENYTEFLLP